MNSGYWEIRKKKTSLERIKETLFESIVEENLKIISIIKIDNSTGTIAEKSVQYEGTDFIFKDKNSYMPMVLEKGKRGSIVCLADGNQLLYFENVDRFHTFFKNKILCKMELNWITEFDPLQKVCNKRKLTLLNNEFHLI